MADEIGNDPALLQEFLGESRDALQRIDEDLVRLEGAPDDSELVHRIFRAVHNIKGSSGFFAFEQIVRVAHAAEDVLSLVR
jgi:two-component system chemotaxis sensor kinase CheA